MKKSNVEVYKLSKSGKPVRRTRRSSSIMGFQFIYGNAKPGERWFMNGKEVDLTRHFEIREEDEINIGEMIRDMIRLNP